MTYISVRPERHSYEMIKNSGEFVINLTTKQLTRATDFCGVRSGRDVDKFKEARLTKEEAQVVDAPVSYTHLDVYKRQEYQWKK